MKQINKIENFSKTTQSNNSFNKTTTKALPKNYEKNLQNIKNLKKLFLLSPKFSPSQQNKKIQTNAHLNIRTINKKILKNFASTTNKFYHSSLSSLSYSNINSERKKINFDANNINKEKIIVLELDNKNKFNENIMPSIQELNTQDLLNEKNMKKIKKSLSNNEPNYTKNINKKKYKIKHLRNNKRKNFNNVSSKAISNDVINSNENSIMNKNLSQSTKKTGDNNLNKKIVKNKRKINYYSFNDIINGLTRNVNVVNSSNSKEIHLKLLRKLDELIQFPSLNSTRQDDSIQKNINQTNKNYSYINIIKKNEKTEKEEEKYLLSDNTIMKKFLDKNNEKKILTTKKKLFLNYEPQINKTDLIEDLKFLGNDNKLDWNLISKAERKKGEEIWKKLINIKKDVDINCKLNKEKNRDNINEIIKLKTRRENIKNILFMSENNKNSNHLRKIIVLKQGKKLEPVKLSDPSPIETNINSNIIQDNILNNKIDKYNDFSKGNPKLILSVKKIIPNNKILSNFQINKIKNNNIKTEKIKTKKNIEGLSLDNDDNLDMTNEEGKSISINTLNKEQEELSNDENEDEEFKTDNKEILNELNLYHKTSELLSNENFAEDARQKYNYNENILDEINIKNEEKYKKQEEEKKMFSIDNILNEINKEKEKEKEKEKKKTIEKKENESDEDDVEERKRRYEKSKQLYLEEKRNRELLLQKLRKKKTKPKKDVRPSIYEFLKELSNSKISSSVSHVHDTKKRKYFKNINNVQDINKRKMELLLNFKNDVEYKFMRGQIKSFEKLEFNEFIKRINSTTLNSLDEKSIKEYLDQLEDYFNTFENDMNHIERMKKNEERINLFKRNLIDNLNFSEKLRENTIKYYANPIDFIDVNHINELSLYDIKQKDS